MKHLACLLWRRVLLFTFLLGLVLPPSVTYAVVGDVTLTGLPPNTSVTLTNEETKERVEQKTDDRGFVIIPLTGKNWQSGRHSVTCHVDGKPVASKIFLRDGANRVDLTALTYSVKPLDPAKAQKVDEALKKSSAALKANPTDQQALLTQGAALNRLGRPAEALFKLAHASKMASNHPALAFETGWSLLRLGMYREAIVWLEDYEKSRPGLGQTSEFIGRAHLFMGELDKADAKFKEALQRDPKLTSTVRFHQAILETLRKNPEAASNHIGALLKEAPNSPMAQIFKNALLQAPGTKPAPGAGAKDFALSDPMKITLPPTTAGDVAGAVAKGLAGTLLGGLFGGRRRDEDDRPDGPKLTPKPNYPEWTFASKDGKTKVNLSGALRDGKPNIVMGVKESPGNGAPHLIMLQDKNCNVMQPTQMSVTNIWEQWGGWKLTVSWTKSYYQDGRLVKQEKGGWSTPWNIFRTQIKDPSEIPGIWKDFGGKPFEGIREVLSTFEPAPGVPFIPADWNLITHATTNIGNNQILTAPFVAGLGTDKDGYLTFDQRERTVCETTPATDPLLANLITFPWSVGPFGIDIVPDTKSTYSHPFTPGVEFEVARSVKLGVRYADRNIPAVPRDTGGLSRSDYLGTPATTETRTDPPITDLFKDSPPPVTIPNPFARFNYPPPDGPVIETRPDGSKIATYPDGTKIETPPPSLLFGIQPFSRSKNPWLTGIGFSFGSWFGDPPPSQQPAHGLFSRIPFDPPGARRLTEEIRPDGTRIETFTHGIRVESRPDGTRIETLSSGTVIETRPDGTRITTNPDGTSSVTLPVDSSVEVEPDVPGLEDSDNAPPVDQVM